MSKSGAMPVPTEDPDHHFMLMPPHADNHEAHHEGSTLMNTPKAEQSGNFSFLTGVCFSVNYIMGCGFLGVPAAFASSGIVLGILLMIIMTIFCNVTKDFMLEAMARSHAVSEYQTHRSIHTPDYNLGARKYEITEMCEMFAGRHAKSGFMFLMWLMLFGVLWAYASVWSASLAANIPLFHGTTCNVETDSDCWDTYHVFLAVFAVIVVPLSLCDLKEQVWLQLTMSGARVIIVLLLLGTIVVGTGCHDTVFNSGPYNKPPMFDFSGINVLIPVAVYSQVFHHGIPTLAHDIKDKRRLNAVFGTAFSITCGWYILIGLILALQFGTGVAAQCNLEWQHYLGCALNSSDSPSVVARIISFIVLIFPALDVMSVYPLNAIALGNNALAAYLGADHTTKSVTEQKRLKIIFRLACSVPPLIGAFFESNLDVILQWTGMVGFVVAFFMPGGLWIKSRDLVNRLFPNTPEATPYRSMFHFRGIAYAVIISMALLLAYIFIATCLHVAHVQGW